MRVHGRGCKTDRFSHSQMSRLFGLLFAGIFRPTRWALPFISLFCSHKAPVNSTESVATESVLPTWYLLWLPSWISTGNFKSLKEKIKKRDKPIVIRISVKNVLKFRVFSNAACFHNSQSTMIGWWSEAMSAGVHRMLSDYARPLGRACHRRQ